MKAAYRHQDNLSVAERSPRSIAARHSKNAWTTSRQTTSKAWRTASSTPKFLMQCCITLLAALPQGVLPSELKWTQHTASHFAASILELSLTPTIEDPSAVQVPDPVRSHYITAAHGTNWASAFSILRESMIRSLLLLKFCFSSLCLTSARWKRNANSIAC